MYINRLLQTDVYNLSHGYMKCNVDFEASHIVNRKAPHTAKWTTYTDFL